MNDILATSATRRDTLQRLLGAGALALPGVTLPLGARADEATARAFESQRAAHPWTQAYVGVQADVAAMPMTLHGKLPTGLHGAFLRNGPARHALGGTRYHHWFDGDGLMQRYTLGAQGITHEGRFVRTEKFVADTAAGRPMSSGFGTFLADAKPPTGPDSLNTANTSVVKHAGELMALWEGGSAYRLDEKTLETRGIKTWSPDFAGVPFSAHPRIEPDGTLWNFGVSAMAGRLAIYRVRPDGVLATATTLPVPDIAMVHDFAVTEKHLVFLLPPLVFDVARMKSGTSFLDAHVWKPQLGLRVLVLPKDALDKPQWFDLPAGFVFHIGNAWEDKDGVIRLDCMRASDAWNATTGLKELMRGHFAIEEFAQLTLIEVDLKAKRARQQVLPQRSEFPRIDPRYTGRRHQQVFAALRLSPGDRPGYDAVMRHDIGRGQTDHYRYGADVMVEEHLFVPRPGSTREGDGWVLGSALDLARGRTLFSVFEAQRLADGPVAQAEMPRLMPFGLHAIHVPA
ncbi:carotenoid oxygenase family protein [Piscinibacter gummiphilus]|uniref:Carotenoid oxygenase family protein n=1 Tax=Piscinibacter gummiphilus TaxID=946333 RepID=A0ABZ0CUL0_9BURK|nr:carotenoid oxygenase family protein [Piscinibacter gummiphilus]WOB06821.1 carotenoid oxygenase family protein [Piscinibacter gummiphilus]